jgi:hypothetical protein
MQVKKSITSFLLIGILAAHVSVRIMAKDAYLISVSDHTNTELAATPATEEATMVSVSIDHFEGQTSSVARMASFYCPAP